LRTIIYETLKHQQVRFIVHKYIQIKYSRCKKWIYHSTFVSYQKFWYTEGIEWFAFVPKNYGTQWEHSTFISYQKNWYMKGIQCFHVTTKTSQFLLTVPKQT